MAYIDLLDRLNEYCHGDFVPMHMPGTKRNTDLFFMPNPYGLDITEIDGFDNLHHAQDVLADSFLRCAKLFGADETLFLVNGSSAGILAAICGATKKRDCVIVARNSHVSVYHALYLNELRPQYLYPAYLHEGAGICAGITADQVQRAFAKAEEECEKPSAVIITSPTYEGVISEVAEIAQIAHAHGAVLIVDEAHGAHFPFHEMFPQSAVTCGADAVIQSIHKTLPAFTQTALLHLNKGRIDAERIRRYWDMYQSTSPSYLLLAGIDRCVTFLCESGKEAFAEYGRRLRTLRKDLSLLDNIKLLDTDDLSKIVLLVQNGRWLYDKLRTVYHIQPEMASLKYVIAMTAVGDKQVYYDRFVQAMKELDKELCMQKSGNKARESEILASAVTGMMNTKGIIDTVSAHTVSAVDTTKAVDTVGIAGMPYPERKLEIYDALNCETETVGLEAAVGRIAAKNICFYPPGVPLVVPGEVISKECVMLMESGINAGLDVLGISLEKVQTQAEDKEQNAGRGGNGEEDRGKKRNTKPKKEVEILCLK